MFIVGVSVFGFGLFAATLGAVNGQQSESATPPTRRSTSGLHYARATPWETIAIMMFNNPRLKQCLVDSGMADVAGVEVRFVPSPDGSSATDITLSPAELRGTPVEACVAGVVGEMHFPAYDGDPVPIVFQLDRASAPP